MVVDLLPPVEHGWPRPPVLHERMRWPVLPTHRNVAVRSIFYWSGTRVLSSLALVFALRYAASLDRAFTLYFIV